MPIWDAQGKFCGYRGVASDITLQKSAEDETRRLAFYDSLTQLPNRRLFGERLGHALAASVRNGLYGALMFIDLDNFKPLNDLHGHSVGDLLLIEVAQRMTSCVREVDTVARFGGDEFAVILSELDEDVSAARAKAAIVAEKLRATLAEPYVLAVLHGEDAADSVTHHCTASMGVAMFRGHAASNKEILKWADMAMYQAKSDGRNLIRFHDSSAE
jgi:diguanylate cyclase (GGDEF)-like protein